MDADDQPLAAPDAYRYCPECGQSLETVAARLRCARCGFVRYRNPAVGVAVVLRDDRGGILLGRRARGTYAGLWCIPCGYVEWEEDVRAAAVREFAEETGLTVDLGPVLAVHSNFHNPRQHTVGVWFLGKRLRGELEPHDGELDALAFWQPAAPPPLAFPTDRLVLEQIAEGDQRGE